MSMIIRSLKKLVLGSSIVGDESSGGGSGLSTPRVSDDEGVGSGVVGALPTTGGLPILPQSRTPPSIPPSGRIPSIPSDSEEDEWLDSGILGRRPIHVDAETISIDNEKHEPRKKRNENKYSNYGVDRSETGDKGRSFNQTDIYDIEERYKKSRNYLPKIEYKKVTHLRLDNFTEYCESMSRLGYSREWPSIFYKPAIQQMKTYDF